MRTITRAGTMVHRPAGNGGRTEEVSCTRDHMEWQEETLEAPAERHRNLYAAEEIA